MVEQMKWIKFSENPPTEKKKYLCFVHEQKNYNKHKDFYTFNGTNFIDDTVLGMDRIVEVNYYIDLDKFDPQEDIDKNDIFDKFANHIFDKLLLKS